MKTVKLAMINSCELIKDAGVDLNIKFLTRIGITTEGKIRPFNVVLESGHERYLLLKYLMKPKDNQGLLAYFVFGSFLHAAIKNWCLWHLT